MSRNAQISTMKLSNKTTCLTLHPSQYQTLARRLLPARSKDSVSFSEINSLMSAHLAGVLLPSSTVYKEEGKEEERTEPIELDEVFRALVYYVTSYFYFKF